MPAQAPAGDDPCRDGGEGDVAAEEADGGWGGVDAVF